MGNIITRLENELLKREKRHFQEGLKEKIKALVTYLENELGKEFVVRNKVLKEIGSVWQASHLYSDKYADVVEKELLEKAIENHLNKLETLKEQNEEILEVTDYLR